MVKSEYTDSAAQSTLSGAFIQTYEPTKHSQAIFVFRKKKLKKSAEKIV